MEGDVAVAERPKQLSFEGFVVEGNRGNLQASVLLLEGPLKLGTQVNVKVTAQVAEVRYGGEPPTRTHVLKVLECEVE